MVGYASPEDFKNMVHSNLIRNYPVTSYDVVMSGKICYPNVATLKLKTIHNTQELVLTDYVKIPQEIIDINKDITLTDDVMFIDGFG
jgi:hypothetical protein